MSKAMLALKALKAFKELKEFKKRVMWEFVGQLEKAFLLKALKATNGNISRAAERVGVQRPNFYALMKKHKLLSKSEGDLP